MAIAESALFFNNDKQRYCLIPLRNLHHVKENIDGINIKYQLYRKRKILEDITLFVCEFHYTHHKCYLS
jgi:hypothetical protein